MYTHQCLFINHLFNYYSVHTQGGQNRGGFDLLAWNINRGRDMGIPGQSVSLMKGSRFIDEQCSGYTLIRDLVLGSKVQTWAQMSQHLMWGPRIVTALKSLYK